MSIPDDYVLTGSYQQQVERLGRMVAPFMMRAVAQNLLDLGVFNGNT
jgi:site-specific DNA-cytosine methylase